MADGVDIYMMLSRVQRSSRHEVLPLDSVYIKDRVDQILKKPYNKNYCILKENNKFKLFSVTIYTSICLLCVIERRS